MQTSPQTDQANQIPNWLKYGLGLLVTGFFLQIVATWSRSAAYSLAVLVLLGFLSVGNRIGIVYDTLHSLGIA